MRRTLAAACLGCAAMAGVTMQARGDERATTEAFLQEAEREPARKAATADVVRRAREAIERAVRFRTAGDETHAKLADGLARELAETARDLGATVDAEKRASEARRGAIDAGAQAERERALLEEGIAHNGRLRAELEEAERTTKEAPLKTNAAGAAATTDGGASGTGGAKPGAKGTAPRANATDGGAK